MFFGNIDCLQVFLSFGVVVTSSVLQLGCSPNWSFYALRNELNVISQRKIILLQHLRSYFIISDCEKLRVLSDTMTDRSWSVSMGCMKPVLTTTLNGGLEEKKKINFSTVSRLL